jgi:hypothetical protein
MQSKLKKPLGDEEMKWRHRSKEKELKEGDEKPSFFMGYLTICWTLF